MHELIALRDGIARTIEMNRHCVEAGRSLAAKSVILFLDDIVGHLGRVIASEEEKSAEGVRKSNG